MQCAFLCFKLHNATPFAISCNVDNFSLNKVFRVMDNAFSSFKIPVKAFVTFVQNGCECCFAAILQNIHCSS
jgi:hypothetical protein